MVQFAISSGQVKIVMDLSAVDYISSMGLRVFIAAQKEAKKRSGEVVIVGLNQMLKQVFDISGFTNLFVFFDNVSEAVSYINE